MNIRSGSLSAPMTVSRRSSSTPGSGRGSGTAAGSGGSTNCGAGRTLVGIGKLLIVGTCTTLIVQHVKFDSIRISSSKFEP